MITNIVVFGTASHFLFESKKIKRLVRKPNEQLFEVDYCLKLENRGLSKCIIYFFCSKLNAESRLNQLTSLFNTVPLGL